MVLATTPTDVRPARVSLIGLPGSGKTTVGRHLAKRLGCRFVDSDAVIVDKAGCSIAEFFDRKGEAAFRDIEERVISELMQSFEGVVATGGGAVLREGNRRALRDRSVVVYLSSSPETIAGHLRSTGKRPLLGSSHPLERLRELHSLREPHYCETAHFFVEAGRVPIAELVTAIAAQLAAAGFPGASPWPLH